LELPAAFKPTAIGGIGLCVLLNATPDPISSAV
jgi:hypothetical protein